MKRFYIAPIMCISLLTFQMSEALAKNCTTGQPCGNSCISWDKVCHIGTIPTLNTPPVANFSIDVTSGVAPLTVNVDASASSDPDGTITSYSWSASDGQLAVGKNATLTFNTSGTHSIILTVIDNGGNSVSTQRTVNVEDSQTPMASFSVTPTQGEVPLAVSLDATASSDPDGSIQSYQWTSSDGQTATGKITSLTFGNAGTYTITLTVTDDKDETTTTQQTVTAQKNDIVTPPITTTQAHLVNISTRAYTSTDLSSVIAGFIIQGTGACNVMIRGFGKGIGLSPLLDSQLLLQTFPDGRELAQNQSWAMGNDINQIPSGLHLPDSSDAGILVQLPAGAYTATMTPESVVGVGLISIDQVSCDANTQLVNISTRAEVRDNLEVVITGFIIDGSGNVRIMLRGFGSGIGLSPCLDTRLRLDKFPSGELITENDNWGTMANATQIPDVLKLPDSTDAGILVVLPAGAYTATMTRTASSCTGVGLIGVDVVQ